VDSAWKWPGSRWWRVDLHAHSPASHDFRTDGTAAADAARRWMESARDAGLHAVAVTDHNSSQFVPALQQAASEVNDAPVLFPGVELTAGDGSRLLLIVDPGAGQEDIDDLLSRMEIPVAERGRTNARTSQSVEAILGGCGGRALIVAAHVDQPAGLLQHAGQQRIAELRDPRLAAVETHPDTDFDESWLDGSKAEIGREISQIWASDSHSFDDLGARYTWVKMTEPTLEGLRLALSDGRDSLKPARRDDLESPNAHAEMAIEKIAVYDTKHMGRPSPTEVRFNPWMNAIIGGRGTGKSTLLDLLRKSMRRDGELDNAGMGQEGSLRTLFDDRMRVPATRSDGGLLTGESRVEVVYRKDGDRFLISWSQDGSAQPIARLSNGDSSPEEGSVSERFPVRIYSQKQLFALAQNPDALLAVLDDAREVDGAGTSRELQRLEGRYLALRAEARQALTLAREMPDRRASLVDVQRKLDLLQQGGHADVLQLYRRRRRTDGTWKAVQEASEHGLDAVGEAVGAMAVADLNLATGDDDATQALQRAHQSLHQLMEDFRSRMLDSIEDVRRRRAEVLQGADAGQWSAAVDAGEEAYRIAVARLEEEGIADPMEYGELVERARGLETEIQELGSEEQRAHRLEREAGAVLGLAFVLGFGSEPIVLDQPEDDLDSTLIYELLVRRFRETKPARQLILVTHNPNIVVHGDAEYVLSLEVQGARTAISREGGLQEQDVRDEICRVMEGGREAFESRYHRIMPLNGVQ